ncbi:MAG: XdhC family protein [Actinomycetales bacterium]|nr:XdhC family protein [Actinomycetales bacterium]
MYDIALSVSACARSGTRADVAWMIAPVVSDDALAFTPGGGRIGSLAGGAFDGLLSDAAERRLPEGRRIAHRVTDFESVVCGLPAGTPVEFLIVPAEQFPAELWPLLLDRRPVAITSALDDDVVTQISVSSWEGADERERELLAVARPTVVATEEGLVTVLAPVERLVVAGQGPYAEAIADQGRLLGWKVVVESRPELVAGLAAALSPLDAIVVMGHDVESSSRCLMAALEGDAGYVGALGSLAMQQSRADWLAYRDITDLDRVHGPAGLDIGARSPVEVAVAIAAEILASRSG